MKDNNKKRKSGLIITIAVIILSLAVIVLSAIIFSKATSLISPSRVGVYSSPGEIGYGDFINLTVQNKNGESLKGWYIPASKDSDVLSHKVLIVSHDYKSSRDLNEIGGIYIFKYFLESGIDVVAFDYSGSGDSEGKYYSFGVDESEELNAVIEYVNGINPESSIALYGIGFGGDAAILAGCGSPYVSNIITDCTIADLDGFMKNNLKQLTGWNSAFFNNTALSLARSMLQVNFEENSPLSAVSEAENKNFFFIHAEKDSIVEKENSLSLAQAVDTDKSIYDIWLIQDINHLECFDNQGEAYVTRIITFLEKHGF